MLDESAEGSEPQCNYRPIAPVYPDLKSCIVVTVDGKSALVFSKMTVDFVPPEMLAGKKCDARWNNNSEHRRHFKWDPGSVGIQPDELLPSDRVDIRYGRDFYEDLYRQSLVGRIKILRVDSDLEAALQLRYGRKAA